jgi:hypothetical protein
MTILAILLVAVGAAAILLLVTADVWLVALLTRLDALLVRMGFGTWLARLVTKAEIRMAERRRRAGKGPGST